jgi:hypothetical protein
MPFPRSQHSWRAAAAALLLLTSLLGPSTSFAHDDSEGTHERAARRGGWDTVTRSLVRAEARRDAGDAAGARLLLEQARGAGPGDARVDGFAALLALDEGRALEADSLATRAIARSGPVIGALRTRARARVALRDLSGALADFDRLLAADPARAEEHVLERTRAAWSLAGAAAALDALEGRTAEGLWTPARRELAEQLERSQGLPNRVRSGEPAVETGAPGRPVSLGSTGATSAANVAISRGPYLQNAAPTAISVRWRTPTALVGRVSIGPAGGPYTLEFDEAVSRTEHEVRVTGLAAGTAYSYSVQGTLETPLAASDARTFRTAPAPGSTQPVRLWSVGDSGSNSLLAQQVRNSYLAWSGGRREDLWVMLGDNAYGAGTDAEYQSGLFDLYPLMLSRSPVWPTRGNHDVLYTGINNDYYDIFTLPAAGEGGGLPSATEAWYSFDWGPIHFVCLDSEGSTRTVGSPMLVWLRADLAATSQPWVIGFWHHPPYTKGSHDSDNITDSAGRMRDMRQNVLPILDSLGVDLVLTGHSHSYERSYLLNGHYGTSGTLTAGMKVDGGDGRPDGDGAYRKSAGTPLANEGAVYAVNGSAAQISGGTLNHPAMVTSLNVAGSMVIDIDGERLEARFLDNAGAVRDSFTVLKQVLASPPEPPGGSPVALSVARPTPFTDRTELSFTLGRAGAARLAVYDVSGRRVRTRVDGDQPAGRQRVTWDGRDDRDQLVAPGAYLVALDAEDVRRVRRVVRLR